MNLSKFYADAIGWALTSGPKIVFGIIVALFGFWMIRLIKTRLQKQIARKKIHSSLRPFLLSLAVTVLHVLLIVVVMEIMGIQLTIFTAVIGAGTVALGLALSGTFQNFAGGIFILLLKPFVIDDNIVAQGVDGVVTSIQLFYTVVLTFDNKTVIIPNGKLFNEIITNVSRQGKRRIDLEIKLGYIIDIDQVKTIITKAINNTNTVIKELTPIIGVSGFDIDGLKIAIKVWSKTEHFLTTGYSLHENILRDLKTAGVKLPGT